MSSRAAHRRIRTSILLLTAMALAVVGSTIALRASNATETRELMGWDGTVAADASVTISSSPGFNELYVGEAETFRVRTTNAGSSNAVALTTTVTLPFLPATPLPASCAPAVPDGNAYTIECVDTLDAFEFTNRDFIVTPPASGYGDSVYASAELTANSYGGADTNAANDFAQSGPYPVLGSELELFATASISTPPFFADPVEARTGETVTFQLNVSNNGTLTSEPTSATFALPSTLTFVAGGGCTPVMVNLYTCPVPAVSTNDDVNVQFTATINANASNQAITTSFSVAAPSSDSTDGDRADDVVVNVLPKADLSITATDSVDPILVGANSGITITVANAGPDAITNGGFSVLLPEQLTYVASSAGCAPQDSSKTQIACDVSVANGASQTFTVDVKGAKAGSASTQIGLGSNFQDPAPANNEVTLTTSVTAPVTPVTPTPPTPPAPTKNTPTSGNDTLTGSELDDILRGLAGDDRLLGFAGKDLLDGGDGTDFLSGGAGDDVLYGGFGGDRLIGGSGDDTLRGGTGDDVLAGAAGNDTLAGNGGLDVISCGAGTDVASGGTGSDLILCRDGSAGAAGRDTVIGGPGSSDVCIVDRFDIVIGCERIFRG